jgi:hypothetical protein
MQFNGPVRILSSSPSPRGMIYSALIPSCFQTSELPLSFFLDTTRSRLAPGTTVYLRGQGFENPGTSELRVWGYSSDVIPVSGEQNLLPGINLVGVVHKKSSPPDFNYLTIEVQTYHGKWFVG